MSLTDLVKVNRSYRRFDQSKPISMETLDELAGLSRYCASAKNLQPLRYWLVADATKNAEVFEGLIWAAYLKNWPGPAENERPTGYIVIASEGKAETWTRADLGIIAQTIMLGAVEKGFGGCMLGALKKDVLIDALDISDGYEVLLVLALGAPSEKVVVDDLEPDGDYKYWRDDADTHHVPKRRMDDVVKGRWPGK